MAKNKEEKVRREIARLEKEKKKPKGPYYLIYMIIIVTLVYIADDLATNVGTQMQNVVASAFFAPIVGEEFAVARMALINTIAGFSVGIAFLYRTLADRFGRKIFLGINSIGIGIGLLFMAIAPNIAVYAVGAFILMFFTPHDMHQVYIQECAPAAHRAKISAVIGSVGTLAMVLIPLMRTVFLKDNDLSKWRFIYLLPAVFALIIAVIAFVFVQESETFVDARLHQLKMTDEEREAAKKAKSKQENGVGLWAALKYCVTHKQIRWLFIGGGFISFGQLATQYYETIMTFGYARQFLNSGAPLESARVEAAVFVTQALMLFAVGSAGINLISGFIADKWGRRPNTIAMCATSLASFLMFYIGSNLTWNPYFVGLCCGICVGSYWAAGSMISLMCAESAPTNIRVSVVAVQPVVNGMIFMLASTAVTILGNILGDAAIGTTVLLVAAPGMAIGLIMMMLKVRETKGVDLGAIRGDEFEGK